MAEDYTPGEDERPAVSGIIRDIQHEVGHWHLKVRFPVSPWVTSYGELHLRGTGKGELFLALTMPPLGLDEEL